MEVLRGVAPLGRGIVLGRMVEGSGGAVAVPTDGSGVDLRGTDLAPSAIGEDGVIADRRFGRIVGVEDGRLAIGGLAGGVVGLGDVEVVIDPTHEAELDVLRLAGGIEVGGGGEVDGLALTYKQRSGEGCVCSTVSGMVGMLVMLAGEVISGW